MTINVLARILLIAMGLTLSACCSAPRATIQTETAFRAKLIEIDANTLVVTLESTSQTLHLDVSASLQLDLTPGQHLYIKALHDETNKLKVTDIQTLS